MHIFNPDPSHFSSCLGTCSSSQLTLAFCGCIRSVKVHCTKCYCGYYAQQLLMISAHICEGYCSCLVCMCLSVCYPLAASVFTPSTNGLFLSGFRQTILMAPIYVYTMCLCMYIQTMKHHTHMLMHVLCIQIVLKCLLQIHTSVQLVQHASMLLPPKLYV